jgi:hypothetical protein
MSNIIKIFSYARPINGYCPVEREKKKIHHAFVMLSKKKSDRCLSILLKHNKFVPFKLISVLD